MSLATLDAHVVLSVLGHCDMTSVLSFARVSHTFRVLVQCFFRAQFYHTLYPYFPDVTSTIKLMHHLNVVISGSTALQFVIREQSSNWSANDIDLYCPKSNAQNFIRFLESQGYFDILRQPPHIDHSDWPRDDLWCYQRFYNDMVCAIDRVVRMQNLHGFTLDVVVSNTEDPLLPITSFWGTLLQNYISTDTFAIAYPRATLRRAGYLAPFRENQENTQKCIQKYQGRGFTINRYVLDPSPYYCPAASRSFADKKTLTFRFDDSVTQIVDAPQTIWRSVSTCSCQPTHQTPIHST